MSLPYFLSRHPGQVGVRRDGLVRAPSRRALECLAYGLNLLTKMLDGPPPSVDPKPDRNSFPSFARPM